MTNIGIYKTKSTTSILRMLSNVITKLNQDNTDNNKRLSLKAKSLLKELGTRTLSEPQASKYKRLAVRFSWI